MLCGLAQHRTAAPGATPFAAAKHSMNQPNNEPDDRRKKENWRSEDREKNQCHHDQRHQDMIWRFTLC